MNRIQVAEKFAGLFEPHRFKVFYGGRDGGKSWTFADALIHIAAREKKRIVCARELQNSISESVHHLLEKRIKHYGLPYTVEKYRIYNDKGSEFIFTGLSNQDAAAVKSLEGADICWVEEAQNVSHASWKNLIPTIRKDGSEIWVSFNPDIEDAPTYQRFVVNTPPDCLLVKVNFNDNPWPSEVLRAEREQLKLTNPAEYKNVWEGYPKTFSDGAYFREEIEQLEADGRIGDVPHEPGKQVYTFWDLGGSSGKSDSMAIWFVQPGDGTGINLIDYWEGNNLSYPKICAQVLDKKPYKYAKDFIPHDGGIEQPQTGQTDKQILEGLGRKVEIIPRTNDLLKDVNNVRLFLPRCKFDRNKCKEGLSALKAYRQEKDPKTGQWKFKHDWSSHGTDAFRYLASKIMSGYTLNAKAVTLAYKPAGFV